MSVAPSCLCGDCRTCRHRVTNRESRRRAAIAAGRVHRRWAVGPLLEVANPIMLRDVTSAQIYRWRARGWLNDSQADRTALALGFHPCEIWTDWWEVMSDAM